MPDTKFEKIQRITSFCKSATPTRGQQNATVDITEFSRELGKEQIELHHLNSQMLQLREIIQYFTK